MKNILTSCVMLISMAMSAQTLSNHVEYPELGVSFDIPSGWAGQEMEGLIVMGHQTIAGLIIVSENANQNTQALKAEAEQGIMDEGVSLKASSDFTVMGNNRAEGFYEGLFDGTQVKAYAIGLISGTGKGMNILILTTPELFSDQHKQEANKLASSVKFFQAKESSELVEWRNYLTGMRLAYMATSGGSDYGGGYSGSSTRENIDLCGNGQFYYDYNSHSSFSAGDGGGGEAGSGYANANDDTYGTYRIYAAAGTTYLELKFANGNVSEYAVTTNSERQHTLLNGTRYFVVENERCN